MREPHEVRPGKVPPHAGVPDRRVHRVALPRLMVQPNPCSYVARALNTSGAMKQIEAAWSALMKMQVMQDRRPHPSW
jgi:hypothetical protein